MNSKKLDPYTCSEVIRSMIPGLLEHENNRDVHGYNNKYIDLATNLCRNLVYALFDFDTAVEKSKGVI